jgi:hypothetical protein
MNRILPVTLLVVLNFASYQIASAHGGGGGSSYKLDKHNNSAEHETRKKAAEKKQEQQNWDDFMKSVNTQAKEKDSGK